jgi:hypothetical protein
MEFYQNELAERGILAAVIDRSDNVTTHFTVRRALSRLDHDTSFLRELMEHFETFILPPITVAHIAILKRAFQEIDAEEIPAREVAARIENFIHV